MEKKKRGLGVRKTAAKNSRRIMETLVDYLVSDSYVYASLIDSGLPPADQRPANPFASFPSPPPISSSLTPCQKTTVVAVKDSFEFCSSRRHARAAGVRGRRPSN
ncbi:hypothetical protein ACLOJK_030562 [Asimina triloba]